MNRTATTLLFVITCFVLGFLLNACGRAPLTGPPELRVGRDECIECGMLVAEDRFSAASLIEQDDERLYVFFDDVGCMLDYEHEKGERIRVLERYVHDHASKAWVAGLDAVFVFADHEKLHTPMGSGIAAFASRPPAQTLADAHAGTLHDFASLAKARREWMWARYGKPETATPAPPLAPTPVQDQPR